jgi:hypothetical protein
VGFQIRQQTLELQERGFAAATDGIGEVEETGCDAVMMEERRANG